MFRTNGAPSTSISRRHLNRFLGARLKNGYYQRAGGAVLAALLGLGALATPAPSHAAAGRTHGVTFKLKANAAKVTAGSKLLLTGEVHQRPRASTVAVQEWTVSSASWVKKDTVDVDAKGAVRYVDRPTKPGKHKYRLVVSVPGARAVVSKSVTVVVWRWIDLTVRGYASRHATVQDAHYVRAEAGPDHGYMTWQLHRRCARVSASFGAVATEKGKALAQLTLDGKVTAEAVVDPGSNFSWGVAGGIPTRTAEIGFHWSKRPTSQAIAKMRARVYCSF